MRKGILLIAVILLSTAGFVQAQEGELHGSLDVTYLSNYIWRGFDYYADDHSAIQPSITLDLYGTGLGLKVGWSRAVHGGFENAERISLALFYGNTAFEGEAYATNYTTGWVYYGFPDEPRSGNSPVTTHGAQAADMQEWFASFSWPGICPAGIVPSYTILTMWPSEGNSAASGNSGWAHIVGLGYDLTVPGLLPETPEQVLHLSAAMVYNDGVAPGVVIGPASGSVDHDWSHAVFGLSTDFDLGNNLTFTPAVYYQSSWDDSVNTQDETWVTLNMKYAF
ncbi:MAG: hypothetical protein ACYSR5_00895 [Planctomycetota bacterium]|jgi:hypothetical protein